MERFTVIAPVLKTDFCQDFSPVSQIYAIYDVLYREVLIMYIQSKI